MNKSEFVAAISTKLSTTKTAAQEIVDGLFDPRDGVIPAAMATSDGLNLVGFGTLGSKRRAARTGRNPANGSTISIAASTAPFFKAGKPLKDRLNQ